LHRNSIDRDDAILRAALRRAARNAVSKPAESEKEGAHSSETSVSTNSSLSGDSSDDIGDIVPGLDLKDSIPSSDDQYDDDQMDQMEKDQNTSTPRARGRVSQPRARGMNMKQFGRGGRRKNGAMRRPKVKRPKTKVINNRTLKKRGTAVDDQDDERKWDNKWCPPSFHRVSQSANAARPILPIKGHLAKELNDSFALQIAQMIAVDPMRENKENHLAVDAADGIDIIYDDNTGDSDHEQIEMNEKGMKSTEIELIEHQKNTAKSMQFEMITIPHHVDNDKVNAFHGDCKSGGRDDDIKE